MLSPKLRKLLMAAMLVATLAIVPLVPASTGSVGAGLPNGEFIVRIYYTDIASLGAPEIQATGLLEYNNLKEHYVLATVDAGLVRMLQSKGWRVEVDSDLTNKLNSPDTFHSGYKTVEEIYEDINALAAAHPTLVQVVDFGDSWLKTQGRGGYDMLAVHISNTSIPGPKPAFFFNAGIHAREIAVPEVALRYIHHLVDNYDTDADAHWLVDWHDTWVVPTENPDGHHIVENGGEGHTSLYQRKNANNSNGGNCSQPPSSFNQYGTDQNRNHSFKWHYPNGGWSNAPCDETYAGASAASEPETQALQDLVRSIFPDQRGPNDTDPAPDNATGILQTMHSNAALNLYPWGWTSSPAPNSNQLRAIARKAQTYNGYTACQPSNCLYYVAGTTDDWSYGELGIASMTTEVDGFDFFVSLSYVDNTIWPENKPMLIYLDKIAKTPYMTVNGPDALNVTVTPSTVHQGESITIQATINDTNNGNNNIAAAYAALDTPPEAGGRPAPLQASDGRFNSPVENVTRTVNVGSLSVGTHVIFVVGKDSTGQFGAMSAAFLTVTP